MSLSKVDIEAAYEPLVKAINNCGKLTDVLHIFSENRVFFEEDPRLGIYVLKEVDKCRHRMSEVVTCCSSAEFVKIKQRTFLKVRETLGSSPSCALEILELVEILHRVHYAIDDFLMAQARGRELDADPLLGASRKRKSKKEGKPSESFPLSGLASDVGELLVALSDSLELLPSKELGRLTILLSRLAKQEPSLALLDSLDLAARELSFRGEKDLQVDFQLMEALAHCYSKLKENKQTATLDGVEALLQRWVDSSDSLLSSTNPRELTRVVGLCLHKVTGSEGGLDSSALVRSYKNAIVKHLDKPELISLVVLQVLSPAGEDHPQAQMLQTLAVDVAEAIMGSKGEDGAFCVEPATICELIDCFGRWGRPLPGEGPHIFEKYLSNRIMELTPEEVSKVLPVFGKDPSSDFASSCVSFIHLRMEEMSPGVLARCLTFAGAADPSLVKAAIQKLKGGKKSGVSFFQGLEGDVISSLAKISEEHEGSGGGGAEPLWVSALKELGKVPFSDVELVKKMSRRGVTDAAFYEKNLKHCRSTSEKITILRSISEVSLNVRSDVAWVPPLTEGGGKEVNGRREDEERWVVGLERMEFRAHLADACDEISRNVQAFSADLISDFLFVLGAMRVKPEADLVVIMRFLLKKVESMSLNRIAELLWALGVLRVEPNLFVKSLFTRSEQLLKEEEEPDMRSGRTAALLINAAAMMSMDSRLRKLLNSVAQLAVKVLESLLDPLPSSFLPSTLYFGRSLVLCRYLFVSRGVEVDPDLIGNLAVECQKAGKEARERPTWKFSKQLTFAAQNVEGERGSLGIGSWIAEMFPVDVAFIDKSKSRKGGNVAFDFLRPAQILRNKEGCPLPPSFTFGAPPPPPFSSSSSCDGFNLIFRVLMCKLNWSYIPISQGEWFGVGGKMIDQAVFLKRHLVACRRGGRGLLFAPSPLQFALDDGMESDATI